MPHFLSGGQENPWCSEQFDLNNSFIQVKWLLSAAPSNTDDSLAGAIGKMAQAVAG